MITNLFDVSGKLALVTGASSGLGHHLAGTLTKAGATVVLAARRLASVQEAAKSLEDLGHRASAVHMDVTQTATVIAAFDEIERRYGRKVQILVNNAGIIHFGKFLDHDDQDVSRILDTNFKGGFAVAREGARRMVEGGGGSIINMSSTAGLRTPGYLSAYASSKAALIKLTEVMALELAHKNVRVNAICPGNFITEMHQVFADNHIEDGIVKRIPQRRFGNPEDLDGPLLLLASDAGRYMTGAVVKVDGGQTLSWL